MIFDEEKMKTARIFSILFLIMVMGFTYSISSQEVDAFSHCNEPLAPFVNLSGCDLTYREFQNADLSNADLSGVILNDLNLSNVTFCINYALNMQTIRK